MVGTLSAWAAAAVAACLQLWWLLPVAVAGTYALLWLSHSVFEGNLPVTLRHPLWSWLADHRMVWFMLRRRMSAEAARCAGLRPTA